MGILSTIRKFLQWLASFVDTRKARPLSLGPAKPKSSLPRGVGSGQKKTTPKTVPIVTTAPLPKESKVPPATTLPAKSLPESPEVPKTDPQNEKDASEKGINVIRTLPQKTKETMESNTEKTQRPPTTKYSEEFNYLDHLIRFRIRQALSQKSEAHLEPAMPPLEKWSVHLRKFVSRTAWKDDQSAKTLLLVALAPYVYPDLFDDAIFDSLQELKKERIDRIGGVRGKNCPFFLPTGETAIFLIGDNNHSARQKVQELFGAEHDFWEKKILWLEDLQGDEPPMHGKLIMNTDYVDLMTTGHHKSPQFSISFPARKIPFTRRTLDDLIVSGNLKNQIAQIKAWLLHKDELQEKFGELIKKGYRTLFYGPPGTGKTFTAMIIGKDVGLEVYKIDLSMIVSKYIGETEKNLEQLFSRAKDKNWILFFDEADALFGKRTNVRDAHDKYANQEVSYLLQRIEDYDGLVILATNMKNNIDDAFCRRFNSVLHFPFPEAEHRYVLWIKSFFPKAKIEGTIVTLEEEDMGDFAFSYGPESEENIGIETIAEVVKKYELSGGSISNVVQYAIIKAMERYHLMREEHKKVLASQGVLVSDEMEPDPCNPDPVFTIYLSEIIDGIKNELIKEGKPFR